jgi:hypothetical protein
MLVDFFSVKVCAIISSKQHKLALRIPKYNEVQQVLLIQTDEVHHENAEAKRGDFVNSLDHIDLDRSK